MGGPFELPGILYTLAFVSFLVSSTWAFLRWRWASIKLPYPPGPPEKGLLSGNLRDISVGKPWHTYTEWGKKYGDIIHFRVYDKHTIVLNSLEDNVELLEKRSGIYSDRPYLPMLDLMGWVNFTTGLLPYSSKWRFHRRMFQQFLKAESSLRYQPTQTKKTCDFLYGILTTPDDFINHYRTLAGAIIMSTMYGYDVAPKDDYFVGLAERALKRLSASALDASLFSTFPFLHYLPSWFPGTKLKQFALEGKKWAHEMRDIPLGFVQQQIKEGLAPQCVAGDLLETYKSEEEMETIAGVVVTSYAAGAETLVSVLGTFFLTMTLFPDAQGRAKSEIDTVVGSECLITHNDRPSLPYVEALLREVLRWRPVLPLSFSHACSSDDVYKGFYIPKGATVMSNVWAIAHDPQRYPEPDTFNPSRFLDESGKLVDDDVGYIFGFGRRICPGRHMASATAWLAIATTLQNFDIQRKQNSTINGEYGDGLTSHPLPFECSITPRSAVARNNILEAVGKPL